MERFSRNKKRNKVPALIKLYNEAIGGADLLDSSVAMCRIHIKGKKMVVVTFYKHFYWMEDILCY